MRSGRNHIRQMLHTTRTRKCSLRILQSLETVRLLPELLAFVIMKVFVAVAMFVLVQSALPEACPFNCKCTKYKILCRDTRLRSLPQGRPTTTLVSMKGDVLGTLNETVVSKASLGNVRTLKLIETNIKVIQSHAFVSVGNLESLSISKNNISDLQPTAFVGLDKLIYLDLSDNRLIYISTGTFEGLGGLRYLQLAGNYIREILNGTFDGLRWGCSSRVVNTLRRIDLPYNRILKVEDGAFRGLCSLHSLIIQFCGNSYCQYTSYSGHFNSISSLRRLQIILRGYNSRPVNMTMRGLVNLTHLNIYRIILSNLKNRFLEDSKLLRKLFIVLCGVKQLELGSFQGLQSLSELNLSHNELRSLPEGVFQDLPSLQKLDLSYNYIKVIKRNMFMGLSRLRILVLTRNQISTIEGNAFSNLPYLRELLLYISTIRYNFIPQLYFRDIYDLYNYEHRQFRVIERIDSDAFEGLFSIKSLQLPFCSQQNSTNVTLQSLDRLDSLKGPEHFAIENLQVAKDLTFLISGHLIPSNINKWLREVMHLQLPVTLEMIRLKSLSGLELISGFHIKSLSLINCESCVIINNTFVGFSQLQSLTIATAVSKIQIAQGAFSGLKTLQNLQLCSDTGFDFAAGEFQELGMLKNLVLIGTYYEPSQSFVSITNELKWLTDIRELVLEKLGIRSLGEFTFLELGSLEKLDISINKIYRLNSTQLRGLRNLKIFNLSYNIISNLSVGAFEGLGSIEVINLGSNNIQIISAGVFGAICSDNFTLTCGNLTQLDKYCNTSFALGTLIKLDLSDNSIEYINKHAFLGCNKLQELNLIGNYLQTIDFLFIPQLTTFHVRSNISTISNATFRCTPMLTEIELSSSNTLSMEVNAVNYLKNLKYFSSPKMNIECKLQELWLYLRSRDITYHIDTQVNIDSELSKLECNSSTDDTTQPRNESSTANQYMYFKIYIEPIVFIFIFLSGCFGNGLLLFIVLRHSDMRNSNNACVAHLAIADILSIVLNLPLSYWDVLHVNWDLGETTCKIFITSKDLVVALVVFSVVALTFERYLVVQIFKKLNSPHSNSARPIVFLVIVWMYSLICSIPSYFHATVEGRCLSSLPGRHGYVQRQWTFQLLMNCILPLVSIVSLNILSAYTLKKSISQIPGQIRNQSRVASRNTVANVVMVLSLVFTLSSLPNFLLRTLVSWSVWTYEEVFWYSFVTYCLYFFHTIFNPFALFVMGSKYKSHIKDYVNFFMREREHVPTSPDVKKELENVCDVLQEFGQRLAGTHQEEDVEEPDDIVARDEAVRRARQERLKKLQEKFKM